MQGRGLLLDADVIGGPGGHDAADAGEPEVGIAGQVVRDGCQARRVVAEEDHGRPCGQDCELRAGRGQLITPDRNEDQVVMPAGVRHYVGFDFDDALAVENVTGAHASCGHVASPWLVPQHRDLVPGGRDVSAVYGSDHTCAYDEHLQGKLLYLGMSGGAGGPGQMELCTE